MFGNTTALSKHILFSADVWHNIRYGRPEATSALDAESEHHLQDAATPIEAVRSHSSLPVNSTYPLQLSITATPNPAAPGTTLSVSIAITNNSSFAHSDVLVSLRYPGQKLASLSESLISDSGNCASSSSCDTPGELLYWNIGTVAAMSTVTVTLPPTILNSLTTGNLIEFRASVAQDGVYITEAKTDVQVQ